MNMSMRYDTGYGHEHCIIAMYVTTKIDSHHLCLDLKLGTQY